jgi:hypothetical protein
MLDRAMPADAVPGSTIPEDTEAEIQLRDGTWVWAQVIGQRKDRQGRWCVGLRWYASPSVGGREGWFLLDGRYIRRPVALLRLVQRSLGCVLRFLLDALGRDAAPAQDGTSRLVRGGQGEQEMLAAEVTVAKPDGVFVGAHRDRAGVPGQVIAHHRRPIRLACLRCTVCLVTPSRVAMSCQDRLFTGR